MDTCPRTSFISFCFIQLRTLCAAHSLATLCLSTTSGPDPVELPGFWGSVPFHHAPIPRKRSGKQQQQQKLKITYIIFKRSTSCCKPDLLLSRVGKYTGKKKLMEALFTCPPVFANGSRERKYPTSTFSKPVIFLTRFQILLYLYSCTYFNKQ